MKSKNETRKKNKLMVAIILTIFALVSISCTTTKNASVKFPTLGEVERKVENRDVYVYDKDNQVVFYFNAENDTVTIPYWYWTKILNYGIDTGGFDK